MRESVSVPGRPKLANLFKNLSIASLDFLMAAEFGMEQAPHGALGSLWGGIGMEQAPNVPLGPHVERDWNGTGST